MYTEQIKEPKRTVPNRRAVMALGGVVLVGIVVLAVALSSGSDEKPTLDRMKSCRICNNLLPSNLRSSLVEGLRMTDKVNKQILSLYPKLHPPSVTMPKQSTRRQTIQQLLTL